MGRERRAAAAVSGGDRGTGRGGLAVARRPPVARDLVASAATDAVWSAQDTTPGEIEEALRHLLVERHAESDGYVPARGLNLVCVVDREGSGEIADRLGPV